MKLFLIGLSLFSLTACSTFKKQSEDFVSDTNQKRSFKVKTAWIRGTPLKENLGFRKSNRMTPISAGNLVIQGNGIDNISAFERETGKKIWTLNIPNGVEPSATIIKDRLFFGANDGNFYSISASTGRVIWTFQTKSENLSTPLLEEGVVYFLAGNNVFYALDAATGKQLWLYSRQDTSQISIRGGSQAATKNDTIYVGFSDGALVALNSKTGNVNWEVQINKNKRFRDIDATPIVDGNFLYVAGYDDKLYCLSADKGEILWKVDGGSFSPVTMLNDKLIYPTSNGEVVAIKKNSGERVWTFKLDEGIATQVIPYRDVIVFGESKGKLQFIDPSSGTLLGSLEPGKGIFAAPQVDEKLNRVYFISGEANLFAVEARWEYLSL